MTNAVIYARFSSHSQSEQSIEGQLAECNAYAQRNGYTIVGEYVDRAISGTTDARPNFLKMIDDAQKKQFQYVIVYQLDRFARNRYDSATYKARLKKCGVRVLSARENIADDASGILVEGVLESMAEYYSAELSQKVQRGMNINAQKAISNGGSIPFGFKTVNKLYVVDDDTAPAVVRIFGMYANGHTIVEINDWLNSHGYRTTLGAPFNKNSLRHLLKNKKYIGTYCYNGVEIPDAIPRIVSDEVFNAVQERLSVNKKAPARTKAISEYLLTTKLFCGHCGEMMTGTSGKSHTGTVYFYYKCNNAKKKACDKKAVKKEVIESFVVAECRKLLTAGNIKKIAKEVVALCEKEADRSELNRLAKQIKDVERRQNNIMSAISECDDETTRKMLFAEMKRLSAEKDDAEKQYEIEKASNVVVTEDEIVFFLSSLKKGKADSLSYRKTLINVFINKIYLYDDRAVFFFNTSGKPKTVNAETLGFATNNDEFAFNLSCFTKVLRLNSGDFFICVLISTELH